MKKIIVVSTLLTLAACASNPKKAETAAANPAPAPTYEEKVKVVALEDLSHKTRCPHDSAYKKENWKTVAMLANACVKAKDWHRVEQLGEHLSVTAHLTPWGAYYLSLAATARKDYPRAQWMLELALKKAPTEGLFHYQLGRIFWEMDNTGDALKELKMAADTNNNLTDAHWIMGQMALKRGDYSEAEKELKIALDQKADHYQALLALASVKAKTSRWDECESTLNRAIRANPRSLKARMALAELQELELKRLTSALETYKEIRRLGATRKLDDRPGMNIDDKIKMIEQSLAQAKEEKKVSSRKPSAEKKVAE